jgi:hypothetical protein
MKRLAVAIFCSVLLYACAKDEVITDDRSKFLGTWNIDATGSTSGHLAYSIEITASNASPTEILMKNFDFQGNSTTTKAETEGNTISIGSQIVNGNTISGSGSYSNNHLTFNYTVVDGVTTDVVTATGTR